MDRWLRLLGSASVIGLCTAAHGNPALTGAWSGQLNGQPLSVAFDAQGGGQVDGRPIRWQATGNVLWIQDRGEVAMYQFQAQGNQLLIAGGQLPGLLTLTRATPGAPAPQRPQAPAAAAPISNQGADLVGRWCKVTSFSATGGGGSQSSACFELRADGSYVYGSERSMSAYAPGMWGGTASSDSDAGRWQASEASITARSNSGRVSTYRLEKRNHPRNRDPMLCLDGECYVTFFRRNPW